MSRVLSRGAKGASGLRSAGLLLVVWRVPGRGLCHTVLVMGVCEAVFCALLYASSGGRHVLSRWTDEGCQCAGSVGGGIQAAFTHYCILPTILPYTFSTVSTTKDFLSVGALLCCLNFTPLN